MNQQNHKTKMQMSETFLLNGILAFSGVALFLLVAQPAQKKKKALMKQQLGGFFRTELTKAFGPEPEPATLPLSLIHI